MHKTTTGINHKLPGISLHHLAFDNSLQANILSNVSSGKIIIANKAACKLLGYSKKEILRKNRAAIFNVNESSFKKMLQQRTAEGKSTAIVTAIKKNSKPLPCEITSAVFIDENGIKTAITTIADLRQSILKQKNIDTKKEKIVDDNIIIALAKSDARLAENNEWIKYIAKASYDVMWDWDIATGEIYVGDSTEEVFGYKVKNNTVYFKDVCLCLLSEEKIRVEKRLKKALDSHSRIWRDSYMFKRHDGSEAFTISRANIVRDADGKAIRMIGAMQDISRQKELEDKVDSEIAIKEKLLTEYEQNFKLIFNSSSDVLYDVDLTADKVKFSDAYEKAFGYKISDNTSSTADWFSHIHPEDREELLKDYHRMLLSKETEWKYSFRFCKADDSVANVLTKCIIVRNDAGTAYRGIGFMQDMSNQKALEEKLEQEIKLKEKQIADATEEAKETERSDIGKELHDNVNQLLGVSKLYLDMAKTGEANSEMYLSRSSEYTFMAIEEIRKLSKVLTTNILSKLGLCEAIENISRDMMEVNPVIIVCALDNSIENSVNNKFKLNIFRIVQEQLNNIVKHANAKNVVITLLQNKKAIILSVSDNGVGFDTNQKRKGIGVANIRSRAISYNGIADFVSKPGHGCVLTVTFSMAKALLAESPQFEAVDDKKSRLVEKIKKVVVELIYSSDEQLKINFSYYLSKKLQYDYTYLANLFSEVEGTTIEKLFISHKIERAKSLLLDDELNLTKIALKLHYSSVAHLSNQFKKVTGLTPTLFKQMNRA